MDSATFSSSLAPMSKRSPFQRALASVSLLACLAAAQPPLRAHAQAENKIAAEALFDRGVALMKEGKFAEACPQLEQSQAIERGIGTMLYLAECYERLGRVASAWALFREAASAARAEGQPDRADLGAARAAKLEPNLPKLRLEVAPGNQMPDFVVLLNGVALSSSAWAAVFPVDPGDTRIEARAPGHRSFLHVEHIAAESATTVVSVPVLDPELQAVAVPAPSAVALVASNGSPPSDAQADGSDAARPWQRPLGLVVGGVGVVGLAIGSYYGLHAISKDNDADKLCPGSGSGCSSQLGVELSQDARSAASLANVLLISGVALVGVGVVLYLTAPAEGAPALAFQGDARSLRVSVGGAL
jgi:tetratricopeptide (TPR) repeat protein